MSGAETPGYAPAVTRQRLLAAVIGIAVAVILVHTAFTILGIASVGDLATLPESWQGPYDAVFAISGWLRGVAVLLGGGFYIAWQRRVTRNLPSLGVSHPRPGLLLSTFAWILPVANLFVPLMNARQVAKESAPAGERSAAALAGWWWTFWLAGGLCLMTANLLYPLADGSELWIAAATATWIANVMLASSGVLVIRMSARITRHQERRIGPNPEASSA